MFIFVSGGVRSGKSAWAETLVDRLREKHSRCVYVATSLITDEEMKERMRLHQVERERSSIRWKTIEQTRDLQHIVPDLTGDDIVLLDCATNWLANELFISNDKWANPAFQSCVIQTMKQGVLAINERVDHVVIVSNDLFEGGVLQDPTFTYMKLLGSFHQWLVQTADLAIAAEAGQLIVKKGSWNGWKIG
ncbi:bifunctional adenosylcobinamide kinase/adenosylcobinamide-phosphate guanylyltransferase [Bacillus songklensis]|uniref:Adenosylcobinamide kinase n=1 Tax=Bacillus songklensis TaxID=1069116 RepID=A0ABV8AW92_9BACI